MQLAEKYRPRNLSQVIGQPWIVHQLQLFVENPHPCAFLFGGDTGTGKTSAALALAAELGVDVDAGEFGGLWQIGSGEQTGQSVKEVMDALRSTPWQGSGWRVLVVNEADCMTPNAAYMWLDKLENLPPRTVVVFTTNDAGRLPARLRDRCEGFHFAGGLALLPYLQEHANRVWRAETGRDDCPDVNDFGTLIDDKGNVSVRRLLQLMQPHVRARQAPVKPTSPVADPAPVIVDALAGVLARKNNGEPMKALAAELGIPVTTLYGRLYRSGLLKKGA